MRTKKHKTILVLISLILGLVYFQQTTAINVYPCSDSAGCVGSGSRGNLSSKRFGFPAAYKETVRFRPTENPTYFESTYERHKINPLVIAANTAFWYVILHFVVNLWSKSKNSQATQRKTTHSKQPKA